MAQKQAHVAEAVIEDITPRVETEAATEDRAMEMPQRFERGRQLAQTLWRATLGATITAQHRTAKMFNRLVEKGTRYQHLMAKAQEHAPPAEEPAEPRLSTVERIHNFEHSIEDRLDKGRDSTLHWIGVPSYKEFDALVAKVDSLAHAVESLQSERAHSYPDEEVPRHL